MGDVALATVGLEYQYGSRRVIRGLNLTVAPGRVYGFLGRNAAGKTTTLRMLLGILTPVGGTVTVDGVTAKRTTPAMRRRIGYVSQQQHFYPWMRVARLGAFVGAFYPTWSKSAFEALCVSLRLEPKQRVGELSGGSKMKLAAALALAHDPPVLVLDEPTAGVDPIARRELLDLLRAQADQGRAVLFSTHHVSEVLDIGDDVGILHDGVLFFQGPVESVGRYARRTQGALPAGVTPLAPDGRGAIGWGPPEVWEGVDAAPVSLESAFVAIATEVARS